MTSYLAEWPTCWRGFSTTKIRSDAKYCWDSPKCAQNWEGLAQPNALREWPESWWVPSGDERKRSLSVALEGGPFLWERRALGARPNVAISSRESCGGARSARGEA